jgi:hypothetical protein
MTVTTIVPVNPAQLAAQLETTTSIVGSLAVQGDPTAAGAVLWSSQWTDEQITAAIAAVTYQAPVPSAQQTAAATVATLVATIPANIAQTQADAAALQAMTPADMTTQAALDIQQRMVSGMADLLTGLQAFVAATGVAT